MPVAPPDGHESSILIAQQQVALRPVRVYLETIGLHPIMRRRVRRQLQAFRRKENVLPPTESRLPCCIHHRCIGSESHREAAKRVNGLLRVFGQQQRYRLV